MSIITQQLLKPIPMTCANCGAAGMAYPYPAPHGTFFCPNCSPQWVEPFAKWASEQMLRVPCD